MSRDEIRKNILATVAYYDVLDYPLTSFEVWKYLMRVDYSGEEDFNKGHSLIDVIEILDGGDLKSFIKEAEGFYFLRGRNGLIERRIKRNKIANLKLKRLRRMVWVLRFAPFIRMIGVTGRLAMKNTPPESDWDLLVILKHGKIWTGRTLVTMVAQILGKRRHGQKIRDRVCLNHFIADKFLISIKDLFSANEYNFLLLLFNSNNAFSRFLIRNSWIRKYKVNFNADLIESLKVVEDTRFSKLIRQFWEKVFAPTWIESALKRWESRKIEANPKTKLGASMVVYTDDELAFWPNFRNQGPKIFEKFKSRIEALENRNHLQNMF